MTALLLIGLDKYKKMCYYTEWQNTISPFFKELSWHNVLFLTTDRILPHILSDVKPKFFSSQKTTQQFRCVLYSYIYIAGPKQQRKASQLKTAILRTDSFERILNASDILSLEEYQAKYRGRLFCCTPGCPAKVKWASYNGRTPFFATWPHSQHDPSCPYAFERDPSKITERSVETFKTRISLEHKQRALRDANKKLKQSDGELPPDPPRNTKPNRSHPKGATEVSRQVPSTDPDAPPEQRGKKSVRLSQKGCRNLSPKNHGKDLTVYGHIVNAELREHSVRFLYDTGDAPSVGLLFYTPFQISSAQRYGWVRQIAQLLRNGKLKDLAVSCLGNCSYDAGVYTIQVMDSDSISINGKSLPAFYASLEDLLKPEDATHNKKRSDAPQSLFL